MDLCELLVRTQLSCVDEKLEDDMFPSRRVFVASEMFALGVYLGRFRGTTVMRLPSIINDCVMI